MTNYSSSSYLPDQSYEPHPVREPSVGLKYILADGLNSYLVVEPVLVMSFVLTDEGEVTRLNVPPTAFLEPLSNWSVQCWKAFSVISSGATVIVRSSGCSLTFIWIENLPLALVATLYVLPSTDMSARALAAFTQVS